MFAAGTDDSSSAQKCPCDYYWVPVGASGPLGKRKSIPPGG